MNERYCLCFYLRIFFPDEVDPSSWWRITLWYLFDRHILIKLVIYYLTFTILSIKCFIDTRTSTLLLQFVGTSVSTSSFSILNILLARAYPWQNNYEGFMLNYFRPIPFYFNFGNSLHLSSNFYVFVETTSQWPLSYTNLSQISDVCAPMRTASKWSFGDDYLWIFTLVDSQS